MFVVIVVVFVCVSVRAVQVCVRERERERSFWGVGCLGKGWVGLTRILRGKLTVYH